MVRFRDAAHVGTGIARSIEGRLQTRKATCMTTDETELERILDGPVKELLGGLAREFGTTACRLSGTLDGIRIEFPSNVFIVVWVTGNDKGNGVTLTLFRIPGATRGTGLNLEPHAHAQSVSETFPLSSGLDESIEEWLKKELDECRRWIPC
jgi:hypothetical protein